MVSDSMCKDVLEKCLYMLDETKRIADSISMQYLKDGALGVLSNAMIKIDRLQEVESLISSISDDAIRSQILRDYACKLATVGRIDDALNVINNIGEEEYKFIALKAVIAGLIRRGEVDRALRVIDSLTTPSFRDELLATAAKVVASLGDIDTLSRIINEISSPTYKASAISLMISIYCAKGEIEKAVAKSNEALGALKELSDTLYMDENKRTYVKDIIAIIKKLLGIESIAISLANAGLSDESRKMINEIMNIIDNIPERDYRLDALRSLIRYASSTESKLNIEDIIEKAKAEYSSITNPYIIAQTMKEIGVYLYKSGRREEGANFLRKAVDMAVSLKESFHRDSLLREIAEDSIGAGYLEIIDKIVEELSSPSTQIKILCRMATMAYRVGDTERAYKALDGAIEISDRIVEPVWRSKSIGDILVALAELRACERVLKLLDKFIETIKTIDKNYSRATIMCEIAAEIASRIKKHST